MSYSYDFSKTASRVGYNNLLHDAETAFYNACITEIKASSPVNATMKVRQGGSGQPVALAVFADGKSDWNLKLYVQVELFGDKVKMSCHKETGLSGKSAKVEKYNLATFNTDQVVAVVMEALSALG